MTQTPNAIPTTAQVGAFRSLSNGRAVALILALSAAVFGFLVWLIYVKPAAGYTSDVIRRLPAVNATFNALSSVFLVLGLRAIKRRQDRRHMQFMLAALTSSALFFVCYVVYHNYHGDTKFAGRGGIRPVYFFILITHITLSAVAVPLILLSFFSSLAGRYRLHRKISKVTFPVWLYVSVTGVLVFALLKAFNS
jgi:putative membrane protein